jgi:hypothetical protein
MKKILLAVIVIMLLGLFNQEIILNRSRIPTTTTKTYFNNFYFILT